MATTERFEALPRTAPGAVADAGHARASVRSWLEGVFEVNQGQQRFLPMEGVRGLAIILVFFVHYHAIFGGYAQRGSIVHVASDFMGLIGNTGVDLFFVLSGYLIYGAALRASTGYVAFMRRRIERIYPTFLAVLALYLVLSMVLPQHSRLPQGTGAALLYVVENVALLPGLFDIHPIISVAWSLSYEMFFYLSVPIIVGAAQLRSWSREARIALWFGFAIAWLAGNASGLVSHPRFVMFATGAILYELSAARWFVSRLGRHGEIPALCVFAVSLPSMYFLRRQFSATPGDGAFLGPVQVTILCVGFFCFVAYCTFFDGLLARAFSWTPLRWLGNMSYSYYLLHGITLNAVAFVVTRFYPPAGDQSLALLAGLPFAFAATVVASALLFLLVEKPLSLRPAARAGTARSSARRDRRA
jgi:exopolysaccharide production protein ExoZ